MSRLAVLALACLLVVTCYAADDDAAPAAGVTAVVQTSQGEIVLGLDPQNAPETVANFVEYANAGAYEGTIFHRVIPGFMIQGGGFSTTMEKRRAGAPVRNESGNRRSNTRRTTAMARTPDPHSATNQFFINVADNPFLDYGAQGAESWGYTVFGDVVSGMEVVDRIQHVTTTTVGPYRDVPETPVVIESVRVHSTEE